MAQDIERDLSYLAGKKVNSAPYDPEVFNELFKEDLRVTSSEEYAQETVEELEELVNSDIAEVVGAQETVEELKEMTDVEAQDQERERQRIHQPLMFEDDDGIEAHEAALDNPEEMNKLFKDDLKAANEIQSQKWEPPAKVTNFLRNKSVVLTGKPPQGWVKDGVAKVLKKDFSVKIVEPRFTKNTEVVIYNKGQLSTQKLQAASSAGLLAIPYDALQLPQATT